MNLNRWRKLLPCLALLTVSSSYAEEDVEVPSFLPTTSTHANWIFSGVVTNENGDNYGYFFQMQRDDEKFHAITALFDNQSKRVITLDEDYAVIENPESYNWKVGRAFLRFNPINDSWIFGLKNKDQKGFNFKVDMLNQPEKNHSVQYLRPGVELIVSQTSHLNGHLQAGAETEEQFVMAKNAWFRQVWLTKTSEKTHPFSGVICRFNDGSGFYSVNMREEDALQGAISGSYDAQGMDTVMSQFINVAKAKDGFWHIRVASPNHHLVLSEVIKQHSIVAGFVSEKEQIGFCMLSTDVLGPSNEPMLIETAQLVETATLGIKKDLLSNG